MVNELYLTIDDFPSQKSEEMLFFLYEHNITAVVFCVGNELVKQEKLAVKALSMGFILGNHSYSHSTFSKLSFNKACAEIQRTDDILQKIYEKAGIGWNKKYFRFPYGDKGDGAFGRVFDQVVDPKKRLRKRKIQQRLTALNYTNFQVPGVTYAYYNNYLAKERDAHWTLDVMEWCLKRKEGMFGYKNEADILDRLFSENPFDCRGNVPEENYGINSSSSNEIILMHDCEATFSAFKLIITEILTRGLRFAQFH